MGSNVWGCLHVLKTFSSIQCLVRAASRRKLTPSCVSYSVSPPFIFTKLHMGHQLWEILDCILTYRLLLRTL